MFTALRDIAARARALFRSTDLDRDLAQELESHLAHAHRGQHPPRHATGSGAPRGPDSHGWPCNPSESSIGWSAGCPPSKPFCRILRFAFRLIAKDRWFSAAVIVVLALGIGANTVGFTIVNAALPAGTAVRGGRPAVRRCRGRIAPADAPTSRTPELQDWRDREPDLRRPRGVSRRDAEHQRRSRAAGTGERHVAHRQHVRRAQAAAAARPRLRGRRRARGRRAGRDHRVQPVEEPVRRRSERARQDDARSTGSRRRSSA